MRYKGEDPCKASVTLIADFCLFLHKEKKLTVQTIEGYRTAINNVLKAETSVDVGTDPHLTALLKNLTQERTTVKSRLPKWDLQLVLKD